MAGLLIGSPLTDRSLIKMSTITTLTGDESSANNDGFVKFWDAASYTPNGGPYNTSTIFFYLFYVGSFNSENNINNIKNLKYDILGDDITNIVSYGSETSKAGSYQTISGASGGLHFSHYDNFYLPLKPVTLSSSGGAPAAITVNLYLSNETAATDVYWNCNANGTEAETHLQVMEVL